MMGISPDANSIIRPLLSVSRQEIEQYLEERKVSYVTDSTNMIDDVVRNKDTFEHYTFTSRDQSIGK